MTTNVQVVIPVYNDWTTLQLLLQKIASLADSKMIGKLSFIIVNDGSSYLCNEQLPDLDIQIVHLRRNLGHQKAIAIGLSIASKKEGTDFIVVMDADGEDKPEHILELLQKAVSYPDKIIFAERKKRSEGLYFILFYAIYKFLFKLLTGKTISFGNFSIIPSKILAHLVYVTEIWNHFSGGVLHSRIPYAVLPLERGKRLGGTSKMNFTSLVLHGMSAVSVHVESVAVRIFIACIILILITFAAISMVTYIKFFTPYATPGWATSFIFGSLGIIIQSFLISLFLIFIILNRRTKKNFIPILDYEVYVAKIETISKASI